MTRSYQCQEPTHYPQKDFWGSDLIALRTQAMKEGGFWKLYEGQFERFGMTWDENLRGQRTINTIDPANMRHVLATDFESYSKPRSRANVNWRLFGRNIFTSDGAKWKHSRSLVKPIFVKAELSNTSQLDVFVEQFLKLLPADGEAFDMMPLLHRLFLDISTDFIFGKAIGALTTNQEEADEFSNNFNKALKMVGQRREAGWTSFFTNWNRDWVDACANTHKFIDLQVQRALRETNQFQADVSGDRYVVLDEMAKVIRDPTQLRFQVLGVFLPARETTSVLVGHTLFQLARHPDVWQKLREIALTVQRPFTFEKMKSLVEFRYVLQETMRTIGPSGRVVRQALKDAILPRGGGPGQESPVFVPKGTNIACNTWSVLHDRELWGDDVEQFRPSRWHGLKPGWEFIPFSGGPRICPAMQQVYMHAIYLLVVLMQNYEKLENQDPVKEWTEKWTMIFESKRGVKVALYKINSEA